MMHYVRWLLLASLLYAAPQTVWAQRTNEFEGGTTTTAPDARPDKNPRRDRVLWDVYRTGPKGTLSGNACFEEVTRKMGFRYVVVPREGRGSIPGVTRFFHNFGVGFLLCFRAGPWWPITLAFKRKECRRKMGDYVG